MGFGKVNAAANLVLNGSVIQYLLKPWVPCESIMVHETANARHGLTIEEMAAVLPKCQFCPRSVLFPRLFYWWCLCQTNPSYTASTLLFVWFVNYVPDSSIFVSHQINISHQLTNIFFSQHTWTKANRTACMQTFQHDTTGCSLLTDIPYKPFCSGPGAQEHALFHAITVMGPTIAQIKVLKLKQRKREIALVWTKTISIFLKEKKNVHEFFIELILWSQNHRACITQQQLPATNEFHSAYLFLSFLVALEHHRC